MKQVCVRWTGGLLYESGDDVDRSVITWTEHFLSRAKLNAVCDTHASQSNQNLSVWDTGRYTQ